MIDNFRRTTFGTAALAGAAILVAAMIGCTADPTEPGIQPERGVVQEPAGFGLIQTVRVTPATPAHGDTITVYSVVHKQAGAAVDVQSRICGLDLGGDMTLEDPFGRCGGYSMHSTLSPGDSVVALTQRVVESGPGRYTLRVRHLVTPELWVPVRIDVTAR